MEIKLINVTKSYGSEIVLNNINLDINQGNYIAIVGESGSGKTTLMSIINTLLNPTRGHIYFNGRLWSRAFLSRAKIRKQDISVITQTPFMFRNLNIRDNIMFPALLGFADRKKTLEKYNEYIRSFNMQKKQKCFPSQLSGGELQKAAIIRALVKPAKLLIADEPTADLDKASEAMLIDIFGRLNKLGMTIIMSTHNDKLTRTAKEVLVLKEGRLSVS